MTNQALIFRNLVNGVPAWQIMRDLHIETESEVMATFRFVLQKIKSYCFERKMLPILCDTVEQAQKHRVQLLIVLPKLNLKKDPKFGKIHNEPFVHETVSLLGGLRPA